MSFGTLIETLKYLPGDENEWMDNLFNESFKKLANSFPELRVNAVGVVN